MSDASTRTGGAGGAAAVSAEEALRRAREIAAKLSGGGGGAAAGGGSGSSLGMMMGASSGINGGSSGVATTTVVSSNGAASSDADAAAAAERKRKRWGVMPPDAAAAASAPPAGPLPGMDDLASLLAKKQKQESSPTAMASPTAAADSILSVHKKVWVSIDGKPRAHYVRYLTSKFDEILQKVSQQFGSSGADNNNNNAAPVLELELHGKGASKEPPIPGMPEQPLHVLIKGTATSAPVASVLVEQALLDAQEAEVSEEDYESEKLLEAASAHTPTAGAIVAVDGDRSLAHYGRGSFLSSSSSSSYRPASVAQLIGAHTNNLPVIVDDTNAIEEELQVPHSVVGLIIGRGGEAIASLQMRTQCKVQIQKESELQPGQTMRLIHLKASTQDAIDAAKSHIERLVQERVGNSLSAAAASATSTQANNPKDAASNKVAEAIAAGHSHVQVPVPEDDVGLVIGKQGMTIRSIQDTTGANVQVPPPVTGQTHRMVDVTHPTMAGAQAAQQMINDLLNSKNRGMTVQGGAVGGNYRGGMNGAHVTIQVPIPDKDVGLCIGRQGVVIRHMQNSTQTRIQIPSHPVPGETFRIASISGPSAGCQQVKLMIETIVAEQSSASVLSGGPLGGASGGYYGGQGQQQQQPMAGGGGGDQQAYSAEWAAYHAAQAAASAAAAQQQQAATAAVAQQQQQQPPAGAEAYQEQFFRYAYYYGEDAARQYYGAWSPPVGTPNPYGVNPNGIQPPPAATSTDAAAATAGTASTSSATAATGVDPNDPLFAATASSSSSSHASAGPAAAAVGQQQQQQQQQMYQPPPQARETSRRQVSNLPAWMTKG